MKFPTYILALVLMILAGSGLAVAGTPRASRVVLIMEENHSYESVMNSSSMPYLKSLAAKYAVATRYYGNTHPSIGNYFELTAGQLLTSNDGTTRTFDVNNIVRSMMPTGKTWKSYAESIPYRGYTGPDQFPYFKHHNPLAYFTDVANSSLKYNLVGTPELSSDVTNHRLPNFSFIVPNAYHDAHNGTLGAADYWLKQRVQPILALPEFQAGGSGLLIITFDESYTSDCRPTTCSSTHPYGGRVVTVFVGPKVKRGYFSTNTYFHQNLLKTIGVSLGLSNFPGASANASSMSDMFLGN
jgi:phosphatidylinositol-3-phosphatase